ncbi:beta-lactamase/transpeptidase-like protein [Rhizodiscina lignyota]|uniref:Beta-lactamase/transpeptidase-like protein n=1 Tax=Rhizodiscina lignyota TaxID=1504668 RepID=A0A9P4I6L6_9PEZI|nr:beta-lactamase/transpeptidase-like protein [Rhizodiscina lignyota]
MAPSARLSPEGVEKIKKILDQHTEENANKVPGAQISILDTKGNQLVHYASGKIVRSDKHDEKRDLAVDDVWRGFSTGKLLLVIMALQLAERGVLDLDDPTLMEKHFPEMAKLKILDGYEDTADGPSSKKALWKDRQKPVTPRMMLNHTCGVSNGWLDGDYREYRMLVPPMNPDLDAVESFWQTITDPTYFFFTMEPGDRFRYSFGPDMLAIILEHMIGENLGNYITKNVIVPLGLKNTYIKHMMEPTPPLEKLYTPYMRGANGLEATPWSEETNYNRSKLPSNYAEYKVFPEGNKHGYSVSGEMYYSAGDYATILAALLNDGVSPTTGARILKPESVKEMAKPNLTPEQLSYRLFAEDGPICKKLDMDTFNPGGNIGLACAVQGKDRVMPDSEKKSGRKAGSAYWYGLGNSEWWVDWESGIAVTIASHYFPWNDEAFRAMVDELEGVIYDALEN